jgi:DNA-binding HxlR family transcriptional regulator
MALSSGAKHFKEIQRSIPSITPLVLSKELTETELNKFVERNIDDGMPLQITYHMMVQSSDNAR